MKIKSKVKSGATAHIKNHNVRVRTNVKAGDDWNARNSRARM
jgi:hypothetical protein